jgi:RNA polymerase sigma-70 factor, ECF subfamily
MPVLESFRAHFPPFAALVSRKATASSDERVLVRLMMERTDAELVEAACHGEVSSFGELYRRHYKAVAGIAYCVLSDQHLAEDAAQETFAIACRNLGRLRSAEKFSPWLSGICRKVARRLAKSKPRHRLPEEIPASENLNPGEEQASMVQQSVERLSGRAKEVIVLHYFSGLTHEQIASMLGISPQAVHGRLLRARRKIAEDLNRNGFKRSES